MLAEDVTSGKEVNRRGLSRHLCVFVPEISSRDVARDPLELHSIRRAECSPPPFRVASRLPIVKMRASVTRAARRVIVCVIRNCARSRSRD